MTSSRLVLTLPQGILTATSLTIEGFAWHRSPGSGKYFSGRSVLVDVATDGDKPAFAFLPEGDWRDAGGDTAIALAAASAGKKTKTALSNYAFSCLPISAYRDVYLVKTGGELLKLDAAGHVATFRGSSCDEGMAPDEIAAAAGLETPATRKPRIYMTLAPVEMLVMSNLTPAEYVWYATHRPGKRFRQVMFAEVDADPKHLLAETLVTSARTELAASTFKKTKTLLFGDCLNRIQFPAWTGYDHTERGGLYVGDRAGVAAWNFPAVIPRSWDRAY